MRWRIVQIIALGILSYFASGVMALIGLAPEDMITKVFGEDVTSFVRSMLMFNENIVRWFFVVISYLSFAGGTTCFTLIPIWGAKRRMREVQQELELVMTEVVAIRRRLSETNSNVRKREKRAKALHEMTRKALEQWRRQKTDEMGLKDE